MALALAEKERALQESAERLANIEAERERYRREAASARKREVRRVDDVMAGVNRRTWRMERLLLYVLRGLAIVAFAGSTLGLGADRYVILDAGGLMAMVGVYHTVQELRQKPKFGFQNILTGLPVEVCGNAWRTCISMGRSTRTPSQPITDRSGGRTDCGSG